MKSASRHEVEIASHHLGFTCHNNPIQKASQGPFSILARLRLAILISKVATIVHVQLRGADGLPVIPTLWLYNRAQNHCILNKVAHGKMVAARVDKSHWLSFTVYCIVESLIEQSSQNDLTLPFRSWA